MSSLSVGDCITWSGDDSHPIAFFSLKKTGDARFECYTKDEFYISPKNLTLFVVELNVILTFVTDSGRGDKERLDKMNEEYVFIDHTGRYVTPSYPYDDYEYCRLHGNGKWRLVT